MMPKHAKNKTDKPKQETWGGQNCSNLIFVKAGNALHWFKQAMGKIWQLSAIQFSLKHKSNAILQFQNGRHFRHAP